MKRFLKKKYIILAVALALVIFAVVKSREGEKPSIFKAERKNIVQEVLVTGKTKARSEVELGFDKSGRISASFVEVGDKVGKGQIIAELDMSQDLASLAKEKSSLVEEEASLGGSGEKLASSIREAFSSADNAVRNKTDQFFKTPRTNPTFEVKFTDGNYTHYFNVPGDVALGLNNSRKSIEFMLATWQSELLLLTPSNAKNFSDRSIERMNFVFNFLNDVADAVNSFTSSDYAYETTVQGYKTAIDSARTSVSSSLNSLLDSNESFSLGTGSSVGDARVNQIKSSIASIEASLEKSKIRAPFSGTVTRQDAKVGQIAQAGTNLVTIISELDMYVEANISEINIGKVSIGNRAEVEFDAYPGEKFMGTLTFIDPGETLIDDVVNYKIRIELDKTDKDIKSGLTVAAKIVSREKTGALSIPFYTVTREGEQTFVNKLENGTPVKTEISLGMVGSNGDAEVLSGLGEGDEVSY